LFVKSVLSPALSFALAALLWPRGAQVEAATVTDTTGGGQPASTMQPSLAITYLVATNAQFPPSAGSPLDAWNDSQPYLGEIRMFAGNFAPTGYALAEGQILTFSSNTALYSLLGTAFGGNGITTFALPDLRGRTVMGVGTGGGLSTYAVGQTSGTNTVTLTTANLPGHVHGLPTGTTGSTGGGQPFENRQAALAVNLQVATEGVLSEVGEIRCFGYNRFADTSGASLPIADYIFLFTQIGTSYGGDGMETFNAPDFRGRVLVGAGQGPGLTDRTPASAGGTETSSLAAANMPAHSHTFAFGTTSASGSGAAISNMQPYLSVRYYICSFGLYPSSSGGSAANSSPFIGEIRAFATTEGEPPSTNNWIPADGRILPIAPNSVLFSVLGAAYGGNGTNTFALPDLRGRVPVGAGDGPMGSFPLGQQTGTENLPLTVSNLPSHTHSLPQAAVGSPTVTNLAMSNVTLGGNVTSDGGAPIAERGIVLAPSLVNTNPQLGGTGVTKITSAGTTGVFNVNATGLTPDTSYTFAAFATNGAGPVYSSNTTFKTLSEIESWRKTFYGSTNNSGAGADNADPYGRGVQNLLVFGLIGPAQNPATAKASQLPLWQWVGNNYQCTFTTPPGVGPIAYSAQYSFSLAPGSWNDLSNVGSGGTNIFSMPAAGREKLFLRLRVVH
jgi:microcystin-dependent protein